MPFYEYFCERCSAESEEFHSMKDDLTGSLCKECRQGQVTRKFSIFNNGSFSNKAPAKVGDIVKDFIKNSSKELKKEQKRMKERKK